MMTKQNVKYQINKFPNYSRPDRSQLDDKKVAYSECVSAKMGNVRENAKLLYAKKNNLSPELRKSFARIQNLVQDCSITVCKADKDGKIVDLDYVDYDRIMLKELSRFVKFPIPHHQIQQHLEKISRMGNHI